MFGGGSYVGLRRVLRRHVDAANCSEATWWLRCCLSSDWSRLFSRASWHRGWKVRGITAHWYLPRPRQHQLSGQQLQYQQPRGLWPPIAQKTNQLWSADTGAALWEMLHPVGRTEPVWLAFGAGSSFCLWALLKVKGSWGGRTTSPWKATHCARPGLAHHQSWEGLTWSSFLHCWLLGMCSSLLENALGFMPLWGFGIAFFRSGEMTQFEVWGGLKWTENPSRSLVHP